LYRTLPFCASARAIIIRCTPPFTKSMIPIYL
jgi:hypothetical protein